MDESFKLKLFDLHFSSKNQDPQAKIQVFQYW